MQIRRAAQPGYPPSPSRFIYGKSGTGGGQTLVLPLDLTLIDFVSNQEQVNLTRKSGEFNGFALNGVGGIINPGYSHPNDASPVGFLTAHCTANLNGVPLAHAANPVGLTAGTALHIEKVVFTPTGWTIVATGYSAKLVGNGFQSRNYLGAMNIDAYTIALDQILQPQMTGTRVTVAATGALLGMLVVARNDAGFALVVPASICP